MRSVEQEYKRLNEQIVPSDALIQRTRELMTEELRADRVSARRKKQLLKKIGSYAAVAAATALVCVSVMTALPRSQSDAAVNDMALPESIVMEYAVEESMTEYDALNESILPNTDRSETETGTATDDQSRDTAAEYADIVIYYVANGQVESFVQENLLCSVDAIFELWAEKNGIHGVIVQSIDVQDTGTSLGVHLDFSSGLTRQLDTAGLMLSALSMTFGEYLNADGVILTCDGMAL